MDKGKSDIVLYDVNDMIAILGISRRTIMTYIKNGKLPCVKIGGKWKITKEALEKFCKGG